MSRRLLVVVPGPSFGTGEMAAYPSRGARLSPLPGLRGALVGTAPLFAGRGRVKPQKSEVKEFILSTDGGTEITSMNDDNNFT